MNPDADTLQAQACPCGSGQTYGTCCLPLIKGERQAPTAEALMRSRYSAYTQAEIEYLRSTLHRSGRPCFDAHQTRQWATTTQWHGLEILATAAGGPQDQSGQVEFIAHYTQEGVRQRHHERAEFIRINDKWLFVSGKAVPPRPFMRAEPKIGRNDPCPCGSARKFKKCCGP